MRARSRRIDAALIFLECQSMLARAPPWLSAMQKVVATFVDLSQTPPDGAIFLVFVLGGGDAVTC
jgi:hypothetical protein